MVNLPPPEPNEQPPSTQRRDNDEAIAVAIALLSVGAILWWGWTRGQQIFAPVVNLPQVTADGVITDNAPGALEADGADDALRSRNERGFLGGLFGGDGDATADVDVADPTARATDDEVATARGRSDRPATDSRSPGDAIDFPAVSGEIDPDEGVAPTELAPNNAASTPTDETATAPLPELTIADVSEDYWAYPYIVSLFEAGLLPNLPSGELRPDQPLTRAELAALLTSSFVGDGQPGQEAIQFADVSADFWAENAISQVVDTGYMVGFPDNTFKPSELVPRYQTLVTMASGLGLTPPEDVDGTLGSLQGAQELPAWSRAQVAAAAAEGIIVNHPDPQQLAPQQPTTRAEAIAFIHEALVARGELEPVDTPYNIPAP